MRVLVVGAGALGSYVAACWARAGHHVTVACRPPSAAVVEREGLSVVTAAGSFGPPVTVLDTTGPSAGRGTGPVDLVALCTKTWAAEQRLREVLAALPGAPAVLTVQNGFSVPDAVARVVGAPAVLAGVARVVVSTPRPGAALLHGSGARLVLGSWSAAGAVPAGIRRLAGDLDAEGLEVGVTADIRAEVWRKLVFAAAFGGVGAATGADAGTVRGVPALRATVTAAMREVVAAARSAGQDLGEEAVTAALGFLDAMDAHARSSLQRDVAAGRPSEVEAWLGDVVRLAGRSEVAVPVLGRLYGSITVRPQATDPAVPRA